MYGKRHGDGSYTYYDGGKYEGEWVDDKVRASPAGVHRSRSSGRGRRAADCAPWRQLGALRLSCQRSSGF